jgi:hypothetical protein
MTRSRGGDTLPAPSSSTPPPCDETDPAGAAPRVPRESDADFVTSASGSSGVTGSVSLDDARLGEASARRLIDGVFAAAGLAVQHDFPFTAGETILVLDGFDPRANVGYQFVSHGDADVVTDFDTAAEEALRSLDRAGQVRILVVHDGDVSDSDDLIARARAFLARLDRPRPG